MLAPATETVSVSNSAPQLRALTGLRFIAALAVFYHHCANAMNLPRPSVALGGAAVSFFFVLSGFILTYVYSGRLNSRGDITRYYFTRWARIWPLHIVCLLIVVFFLGSPAWMQESVWKWPLFAANALLLQSWLPLESLAISYNGPSWSISNEMFFYLMFPFLLRGSRKQFWIKLTSLAVLTLLALAAIQQVILAGKMPDWIDPASLVQFNPALRLLEFVAGMAAGRWFLSSQSSESSLKTPGLATSTLMELGAIAILYLTATQLLDRHSQWVVRQSPHFGTPFATWLRFSGYLVCFVLLIRVFASSRGLFARWLSTPTMVYLGDISFALYMIHQPVLRFMKQNFLVEDPALGWYMLAVAGAISLGLSAMLYHGVERTSKDFLLKMYGRKWLATWQTLLVPMREYFLTSRFVISVLSVVMGLLVLYVVEYTGKGLNRERRKVAALAGHDPVKFGDEATLLDHRLRMANNGWMLRMVWQKGPETDCRRYIHVCDSEANRIRFVPAAQKVFSNRRAGEIWVEEIVLSESTLEGATFLRIGFHHPEKGSVKVDRSDHPPDLIASNGTGVRIRVPSTP